MEGIPAQNEMLAKQFSRQREVYLKLTGESIMLAIPYTFMLAFAICHVFQTFSLLSRRRFVTEVRTYVTRVCVCACVLESIFRPVLFCFCVIHVHSRAV